MRLRDLALVAASLAACGEMPSMMDAGSTGGGLSGAGGGFAATGGGSAAGGSAAGGEAAGGSAAGGSAAGGSAAGGSAAGGSAAGGSAGGGSAAVSFATNVAPILRARCQQACHGGVYQATGSAYTRLRGTTGNTSTCASQPRLVANDAANSLVIKKLLGTQSCGGRMPQVPMGASSRACTGTECATAGEIDLITRWINQGAQNN